MRIKASVADCRFILSLIRIGGLLAEAGCTGLDFC